MSKEDFLRALEERIQEFTLRDGQKIWINQFGTHHDGRIYDIAYLRPGMHRPHIHKEPTSEILVVCGKGISIVDGESMPYGEGSLIRAPAGVSHGFLVDEPTILLSILDKPIYDAEKKKFDFRYADEKE